MPVPEGVEVTADLGQFMLDPGAMIAEAGDVGSDNVVRVAPVGIVDGGDGEDEARKGLVRAGASSTSADCGSKAASTVSTEPGSGRRTGFCSVILGLRPGGKSAIFSSRERRASSSAIL
ncbi:hypothetical protein [Mesorhizobium sp.]|uniref:hypothetical protein n=1 Tax=Mesorhizobium sp. TaxID=1871066 RepID=UPI003421D1BE